MVKRTVKLCVIVLAVILIFAFTLSGCASRRSEFILVQSRVVETTRIDSEVAEVTKTPLYSKMAAQIKSVAISAPSSCANQPASSVTGSAVSKGAIVMTLCGVEMAEIERALIRQGLTVYSWSLINNSNKPAAETAKQLGAQILFQVNSLERVNVSPGFNTRIERSFFGSNAFGEKLNSLTLDESRINEIKAVTGKDEIRQLPSANRLGAMLDINAVDIETGQTLWYYRWRKHEDASRYVFANVLVQCWDNWGCLPEAKQDPDGKQIAHENRSTEVETISTSARPASEQDVIYFGLLQDVTADFVKRFSSGQ